MVAAGAILAEASAAQMDTMIFLARRTVTILKYTIVIYDNAVLKAFQIEVGAVSFIAPNSLHPAPQSAADVRLTSNPQLPQIERSEVHRPGIPMEWNGQAVTSRPAATLVQLEDRGLRMIFVALPRTSNHVKERHQGDCRGSGNREAEREFPFAARRKVSKRQHASNA